MKITYTVLVTIDDETFMPPEVLEAAIDTALEEGGEHTLDSTRARAIESDDSVAR